MDQIILFLSATAAVFAFLTGYLFMVGFQTGREERLDFGLMLVAVVFGAITYLCALQGLPAIDSKLRWLMIPFCALSVWLFVLVCFSIPSLFGWLEKACLCAARKGMQLGEKYKTVVKSADSN